MLAQTDGLAGFLPTRGGLMLDFVFVAMFAILPVMAWSIYLVRYRQAYIVHRTIQMVLAVVLLIAVVAFEVDVRFFTDWQALAEPSPYFERGTWNAVWYSLLIHLAFAIPTPFLWAFVIIQALRKFPHPPRPSSYSATHVFWARFATGGMFLTALTGWIFYWLAFVA